MCARSHTSGLMIGESCSSSRSSERWAISPSVRLRAWSNAASTDSASEVRGWVGAARTAIGGCGSL